MLVILFICLYVHEDARFLCEIRQIILFFKFFYCFWYQYDFFLIQHFHGFHFRYRAHVCWYQYKWRIWQVWDKFFCFIPTGIILWLLKVAVLFIFNFVLFYIMYDICSQCWILLKVICRNYMNFQHFLRVSFFYYSCSCYFENRLTCCFILKENVNL